MEHIIGRTERVERLKKAIRDKQIAYLTAFFSSGKSVLLAQLYSALPEDTLRFDGAKDDWSAFEAAARTRPEATVLIDTLERLPESDQDRLKTFLNEMPKTQRAVLAGRGQMPECLCGLYSNGLVTMLRTDFVLFDEEEIRQLFLDYGIVLKPSDVKFLKETGSGWPLLLHDMAQRMQMDPMRTVLELRREVKRDLCALTVREVLMGFPEDERILLLCLSPFERVSEDLARMVTGRVDAPRVMEAVTRKSWMLIREKEEYTFFPFIRDALLQELKNQYSQEYINNLYRSAALYYELRRDIPHAVEYYATLNDTEKVRNLLINDSHMRPANGDYVQLKKAYSMLPESALLSSPELMKGMCLIESMTCHVEESERWYGELKKFYKSVPPTDGRCQAAMEALVYLDISLPHRGSKNMIPILLSTARMAKLAQSASWQNGFNMAGNSVSLLNGGKDFCRWVPHGDTVYRLFKAPIELALGYSGRGIADIAFGEYRLESSLTGDYTEAMDKLALGLSRTANDLEMQYAAMGVQSRVMMAQGNAEDGARILRNCLDSLPKDAPERLRQNFTVYLLTLKMMLGDMTEAMAWLYDGAPDETGSFNILDRYAYMLKLRLYIVTLQWDKTRFLTALLRNYYDRYDRPYLRVQLHLLQAMIDQRQGIVAWKDEMKSALSIAKRYRLARVVADEGIAVLDMLREMELQKGDWETGVMALTRAQARRYPAFMKPQASRPKFSDKEYLVYSLLINGSKTSEIAGILNMKERTVKYYLTSIYQAMGVKTRAEALKCAAELGDI